MAALDMRTALLAMVCLFGACVTIAGVLWHQNRTRFKGMSLIFAGFLTQCLGILVIALRGVLPNLLTIGMGNILALLGAYGVLLGLERLVGCARTRWLDAALLVAYSALFVWFSLGGVAVETRVYASSIALMAVFARAAWLMLAGVEPWLRHSTRYVGLAFVALFGVYGARIFGVWLLGEGSDFMQAGSFDVVIIMLTGVAAVTMALLIVLMINDLLDTELQTQQGLLATAFRASPNALVMTRMDGTAVYEVNEAFLDLTGYSREEVIGRPSRDLVLWERWDDRDEVVNELREGRPVRGREFGFRNRHGESLVGMVSGEAVAVDGVEYMLVSIVDVTERKRMEEEVRELSLRDQLTGLYNRRGFFTIAEHIVRDAGRRGTPVHVVFLDCDGLKALNDLHGHEAGDRALVAAADLLRATFRSADLIARVGGDEFVVCFYEQDGTTADSALTRLADALAARSAEPSAAWLDLSWGASMLDPASGESLDDALGRADERMYQHKSAKRASGAYADLA